MLEGVDYSWGRPDPAALKAAGKHFAVRYVDYPGAGGKGLTLPEMQALNAAGLSVVLVFETTADRALEGWAAGNEDAARAKLEMNKLWLPFDMPCYFAVDFDAQDSQMPQIQAYFDGVEHILGADRVGVYGSKRVIDYFAPQFRYLWQTYAWSGGLLSDEATLYQYENGVTLAGAEVDLNQAYMEDYGQYPRPNAVVVPPAPPVESMEAVARRVFDEAFPAYFRQMMAAYWASVPNDYTDANGVPTPPDEAVVKAVSEEVLGYWWGKVG